MFKKYKRLAVLATLALTGTLSVATTTVPAGAATAACGEHHRGLQHSLWNRSKPAVCRDRVRRKGTSWPADGPGARKRNESSV